MLEYCDELYEAWRAYVCDGEWGRTLMVDAPVMDSSKSKLCARSRRDRAEITRRDRSPRSACDMFPPCRCEIKGNQTAAATPTPPAEGSLDSVVDGFAAILAVARDDLLEKFKAPTRCTTNLITHLLTRWPPGEYLGEYLRRNSPRRSRRT